MVLHLVTPSNTPPREIFRPLAYVVLATSEMTAQWQYTAVYASTKKLPSKKLIHS